MTDRWAHLGHNLGECWVDPDSKTTYVHIPKNASSFIKGCLLGSGKFTHNPSMIKNDRYLIALRDPIDRWISGIAQFMAIESNKHLTLHDLIDQITFDDHTELQTYFIQDVDVDKCTFFWVDKNLRSNVQQWLGENGYNSDIRNIANLNEGNQLAKDRFAAMVDGNSQFKLKLAKHYKQDYQLINRVKFYGT